MGKSKRIRRNRVDKPQAQSKGLDVTLCDAATLAEKIKAGQTGMVISIGKIIKDLEEKTGDKFDGWGLLK